MFAGSRLWAELDALAQWGHAVDRVVVIPAFGDEEDGGAADRLVTFGRRHFSHVTFMVTEPVNDDLPDDVRQRVLATAAAQAGTGGGGPWLFDASGGTRLMFLGAVRVAEARDDVRVVYRDAGGPWHELAADGSARLLAGVKSRALDDYSVDQLLHVTWSDDEREAHVLGREIEPTVERAARATVAGEPWREAFERACHEQSAIRHVPTGLLFERFVISLLRCMGVQADDVGFNAVLFDGLQRVQEVDVIVNSNGRLHVIDCKLVSDEDGRAIPLSTQIRDAFATRRHLGDGSEQYILLRPNLTIGEEFRSLCASYEIRVIDQFVLDHESLPQALSRLIRPPAPLPGAGPLPSMPVPIPLRGVFDVRGHFENDAPVVVLDTGHFLLARIRTPAPVRRVKHQLDRVLAGIASVTSLKRRDSRNAIDVVIAPHAKCHGAALDVLSGLDGRTW